MALASATMSRRRASSSGTGRVISRQLLCIRQVSNRSLALGFGIVQFGKRTTDLISGIFILSVPCTVQSAHRIINCAESTLEIRLCRQVMLSCGGVEAAREGHVTRTDYAEY